MRSLIFATLVLAGSLFVFPGLAGSTGTAMAAQDFCGTAEVDVPDTGPAFDFTEACMHHDQCYAEGGGPLDRLQCDNQFLSEMNAWCESAWNRFDSRLWRCKLVAATYYTGVRLGGWLYFYNAPV